MKIKEMLAKIIDKGKIEAFFTKEEEDRIDRLLAEVDEEQKRNACGTGVQALRTPLPHTCN